MVVKESGSKHVTEGILPGDEIVDAHRPLRTRLGEIDGFCW